MLMQELLFVLMKILENIESLTYGFSWQNKRRSHISINIKHIEVRQDLMFWYLSFNTQKAFVLNEIHIKVTN